MDSLPSTLTKTEVRVLGTRRERRKMSSLSVRNESSFPFELKRSFWPDFNQSRIYHRVGIFTFKTLLGYARTCTEFHVENLHDSAFSMVLELTIKTDCHWRKTDSSSVTSPTNQASDGRGTGSSSLRLHFKTNVVLWGQWNSVTWIDIWNDNPQHKTTSLQSGTNR